ncbi:MAG: dihydrofolate reductase family protein [Actinomycetota bacterium]|nr:dihydrofolate reductase family protein [Actinomycetota bacterium]
MSTVTCHIAMSLDGYVSGRGQSRDAPFGDAGTRLHEWLFEIGEPGRESDAAVIEEVGQGVGAQIMGRKMFGGGDGSWDETWTGWWGEDPPYHVPVFVLSHHERAPLPMEGGTTFTFVTDGIESALAQARAAAGDQDVAVAGGASTVNQYLAAGLVDELYVHLVPLVLGGGERLLVDVGDLALEQVKVVPSPTVTHIKYRVIH